MRLYRVFPSDPSAAVHESGGAHFVPTSANNRVSNPKEYHELCLSSHAEGAVAEVFGRCPIWEPDMFVTATGLTYALATYDVRATTPIADLDDPAFLLERGLRPSDVVSHDRKRTQDWARGIYLEKRWHGLRWWSYYGPQWTTYALWDIGGLTAAGVPNPLAAGHPAVRRAAEAIVRPLRT